MIGWKKDLIKRVIEEKPNKPLTFIHTPKCGGIYTSHVIENLGIINKKHNLALDDDGICFTVIREPGERFQSLLNYRLDQNYIDPDWPAHLRHVYYDKNISLNELVEKMSDREITGFVPYRSLTHWSKNIDILITIDELEDFLNLFGYQYVPKDPVNVSNKLRGSLGESNLNRIRKLYEKDVKLFNYWTRED